VVDNGRMRYDYVYLTRCLISSILMSANVILLSKTGKFMTTSVIYNCEGLYGVLTDQEVVNLKKYILADVKLTCRAQAQCSLLELIPVPNIGGVVVSTIEIVRYE
jgi:hypothetical protein